MPFLHLPVQSGSDRVLAAMHRPALARRVSGTGRHGLRRARPDIALSSDIIVGFPGETDADFDQTLALGRASPLRPGLLLQIQRAARNAGGEPSNIKCQRR